MGLGAVITDGIDAEIVDVTRLPVHTRRTVHRFDLGLSLDG